MWLDPAPGRGSEPAGAGAFRATPVGVFRYIADALWSTDEAVAHIGGKA